MNEFYGAVPLNKFCEIADQRLAEAGPISNQPRVA